MSQDETLDFPITNKYAFARVFSKSENVRPLLETVLGVPVGEIRYVVSEYEVEPSLRGRGVRMDVFTNDETGAMYDVEMQNVDEGNLALRSRYLLSSFDRDRITRGESYKKLGKSVVIFVCRFDPIGPGDRMYVIVPMVAGHDELYDDGTMRIFLNAHGAAHDPSGQGRLAAFLSYVDGGDTMGDEWVERLDDEVHALNADKGWRDAVLSFELDLQDAEDRGVKKGLEQGLEQGREQEAKLDRLLAEALEERGREAELLAAMKDQQVKQRLLAELGIL